MIDGIGTTAASSRSASGSVGTSTHPGQSTGTPLASLASMLGMRQDDVQAALVQSASSVAGLLALRGLPSRSLDSSLAQGFVLDA